MHIANFEKYSMAEIRSPKKGVINADSQILRNIIWLKQEIQIKIDL